MMKYLPFNFEKPTALDSFVAATKNAMLLGVLFGFVSNVLMLALPIYSLQVLDRVISSQSTETLLALTLVVVACLIGLVLVQMARSNAFTCLGEWMESKMAPVLFNMAMGISVKSKSSVGSQTIRDMNTIKNFIAGNGVATLIDAPWSIIFVIILFRIHPAAGWISVFGALALLLCAYLTDKATKTILEKSQEKLNRSSYNVDAATRNAEVIVSMGMTEDVCKLWLDKANEGRELHIKAMKQSQIYQSITKFLRFVLQVAVTGVGGYLVIRGNGNFTSGQMIAGSILMSRALAPFEAVVGTWKNLILARKSYKRVQELLAKSAENRSDDAVVLPAPKGKLEVENLYFTPAGSKMPIIKGVSFKLEPGEILAIIGESAAGKSTLARLITGVWKANMGEVRLDGADLHEWVHAKGDACGGKYMGYLPQDIELFNGSISLNISRMKENAPDELIVEAAKIAGIHEMVLRLPRGYETPIGVEGMTLSGGQRQRVGLARAFFGNPRYVVLDEPNANLDREGELALSEAIKLAKSKGVTAIVISHRPTILDVVDKILVLHQGTVAAFGKKEDIMRGMIKPAVAPVASPGPMGAPARPAGGPIMTPGSIAIKPNYPAASGNNPPADSTKAAATKEASSEKELPKKATSASASKTKATSKAKPAVKPKSE